LYFLKYKQKKFKYVYLVNSELRIKILYVKKKNYNKEKLARCLAFNRGSVGGAHGARNAVDLEVADVVPGRGERGVRVESERGALRVVVGVGHCVVGLGSGGGTGV
jgi:hypothetical protein